MAKIAIVFYTTYGHIYTMAKAMKEGIDKTEGCEAVLFQVLTTECIRG
jgi:NAD(P)H dehydrogenase (quinone)